MDNESKTIIVNQVEYNDILQKLKQAEAEKNKLARELRIMTRNNEVYKLNFQTQVDITQTISKERARQELYIKLLLQSCPDIVMIFDENGTFLLGTESIKNIIDTDDISILQGRSFEAIIERYHSPVFTEKLINAIKYRYDNADSQVPEERFEITTVDSKYEINVLSFNKSTEEFAGVLVFMHDITELLKTRELAEKASRAKGEFLSRMSHEMRTPMNAIIGMTSIAKGSKNLEKKEYCLDKIDEASRHLLNLINDILDMSKIEADKFELSYHSFDFEKMFQSIANVLSFRIEEKKQNLIINIDKDIPDVIISDELRLTQVITNLLSNAVKFTPENGKIIINAKNLKSKGDGAFLLIEIIDNGIGISPEQQSRLFTAFEQADGGTARKFGGTGLGLAISKRIVQMMGGTIWIESEIDKGSKFAFTIQYQTATEVIDRKVCNNKEEVRILAIDDMPEIREYFSHIMETLGMSCDVASNGNEALEMIKNNKGAPYNIFFVDWQMPEMNGVELTKKIKEITQYKAAIIMISAYEWDVIEKEAVQAGVDNFIPKPLFASSLVDKINEYIGFSTVNDLKTNTLKENDSNNFDGYTILIAEDIEINREIMAAILEDTGISIDFAENGLIAISKFNENPNAYDLIFMDIQMPEMDGLEATRKIRMLKDKIAASIPIIAMTANVFKEDIDSCLEAGMNGHLGKPVNVEEMLKVLKKYLPKK